MSASLLGHVYLFPSPAIGSNTPQLYSRLRVQATGTDYTATSSDGNTQYRFNLCAPVLNKQLCTLAGSALLWMPGSSVCKTIASTTATPVVAAIDGGISLTYTQSGDTCGKPSGAVSPSMPGRMCSLLSGELTGACFWF